MLLRAYGKNRYRHLIQQNLDQSLYLADLILTDEKLELTAPVVSNVVCFRFKHATFSEVEKEHVNRKIMDDINKNAFWMISDTKVKGIYMLRACIVNHRTKKKDLELLVDEIKMLGKKHMLRNSTR